MARILQARVAVTDKNHTVVWFSPGDEVPAWAAKQITNPAAWGDDDQAPTKPAKAPEPDFPQGDPAESWKVPQLTAYAAAHGIDLGEATKKADILKALAAAAAGGDVDDDEGDGDTDGQEDGS